MEGLAAAGGVIAVASLAGQILQGCNYVRDVLDNAHNAPKDIRLLVNELAIIERIVRDTPEAHLHQEELDYCNERVLKLWQVVCKYGDLEDAGHRSKWGKRLAMAMSAEKIQKHLGALREAKGYLENIQNISAHQKTITKSHEVLESIEQLGTSQFEAVRITTRSENKLDDLASVMGKMQQALHELANRVVHRDNLASSWSEEGVDRLVNAMEKILQYRLEKHLQLKDSNAFREDVATRDLRPNSCRLVSANFTENFDRCENPKALVVRKLEYTFQSLQPRIVELPEQAHSEISSWSQRDIPLYTEKRSRYNTPIGQILMRTCSTTYSTASEIAEEQLPVALRRWIRPAQFPFIITQTEIVVVPQNLAQARGAVITCHQMCGAVSRVFDVGYEMKDLTMPACSPFRMRHQPTAGADSVRIGIVTDSIIEKLALGIVKRLRDFFSSCSFSDERIPYFRAAHFTWKMTSKPLRRRGENLDSFFPCMVI